MGTEAVLKSLEWYGKEGFNSAAPEQFTWVDIRNGKHHIGGEMMVKDKFTFLKAFNTGLEVMEEKPEMVYDMLKRWIKQEDGKLKI